MNIVSIKVLVLNKPGILSRLIRILKGFSLFYQMHKIEKLEDSVSMIIQSNGILNSSREDLYSAINGLDGVLEIVEINIGGTINEKIQIPPVVVKEKQYKSTDKITKAIIAATDKKLAEILGPVAPFLIESATYSSDTIGELYTILAEELEEGEKKDFLSIISD